MPRRSVLDGGIPISSNTPLQLVLAWPRLRAHDAQKSVWTPPTLHTFRTVRQNLHHPGRCRLQFDIACSIEAAFLCVHTLNYSNLHELKHHSYSMPLPPNHPPGTVS